MKSITITKKIRPFYFAAFLFVFFFAASECSYGQSINQNWKQDLTTLMDQFLICTSSSGEKYQCSVFIGEALSKVYKLHSFYSEKSSRYLTINEITNPVVENDHWKPLGRAFDQKVLEEAQRCANASKAVIAVYATPSGIQHIALVLPGELHYSGSWGYNVPNSASFFFADTEKSYVGKGLSYAYARNMIKDVTIYCKNY